MRICIDLTSLDDNFSGIERFSSNIAKELIENHPENEYILIFKNSLFSRFEKFLKQKNVDIKTINGKNKLIFNQILLPFVINKINADWKLFLSFPTPFLIFGKRNVSAIHDVSCWDFPKAMTLKQKIFFKLIYRKCVYFDNFIVTVSEFSKRRINIRTKCPLSKIELIKNGISDVFYSNNSELNDKNILKEYGIKKNYLLCLSTLEPRKNLKLAIDAYNELLVNKKIDCDLVLVGRKGWLVDNAFEEIPLEGKKRIHITGFVEDQKLPAFYRNADAFIFPSLYEGFGIPPLEAMKMGTIVISSDSSSMPEVLGDAAIYFENNNKEDLKRKISLIYEKDLRSIFSEKMKLRTSRYSWADQAKKLNKILKIRMLDGRDLKNI